MRDYSVRYEPKYGIEFIVTYNGEDTVVRFPEKLLLERVNSKGMLRDHLVLNGYSPDSRDMTDIMVAAWNELSRMGG